MRLAERQNDLNRRAGEDGSQDLRHTDVEMQRHLAEQVDADDYGGDMQARIAQAGQDNGIVTLADGQAVRTHDGCQA